MKTSPVRPEDLRGVFPVPPLARQPGPARRIDVEQNDRIVQHLRAAGLSRFLYGGNAFLHHVTLGEYEELLGWLASFPDEAWPIPSVGPSFGRAMDQAALLRRHPFPCAMALPCSDPRDALGLESGLREVADAAGLGLVVYLKDELGFGADKEAGLDAVARLARDGICVGIKYAVVRHNPREDAYLEGLLRRVDRNLVVSGIGERPAVVHMRDFGLPGFTTGSGCVAPNSSRELFEACVRGDFAHAESLRERFLPLEDQRDAWGPARVLHAAVAAAGFAETGPIPPFVSALDEGQLEALAPVARELLGTDAASGSEPNSRL